MLNIKLNKKFVILILCMINIEAYCSFLRVEVQNNISKSIEGMIIILRAGGKEVPTKIEKVIEKNSTVSNLTYINTNIISNVRINTVEIIIDANNPSRDMINTVLERYINISCLPIVLDVMSEMNRFCLSPKKITNVELSDLANSIDGHIIPVTSEFSNLKIIITKNYAIDQYEAQGLLSSTGLYVSDVSEDDLR